LSFDRQEKTMDKQFTATLQRPWRRSCVGPSASRRETWWPSTCWSEWATA